MQVGGEDERWRGRGGGEGKRTGGRTAGGAKDEGAVMATAAWIAGRPGKMEEKKEKKHREVVEAMLAVPQDDTGWLHIATVTSKKWRLQSRCNYHTAYVDQWKRWNPERVLTALVDMRLGPGNAHRQVRKSREFLRSLEKPHNWPQNVSWTRSGEKNLKKNSDYLDSGADPPPPSSQQASLACEKANTMFKPTVFRRPGHPPIRSHFYVMLCSLKPRSLHAPFFEG